MFSIIKKYKRNLNNICKIREKGVSLISLIVIIIVLLILAGVTIKISSGDSGLIKKTKKGVAMYQNASVNESETLNEYARKLKTFVEVPKAETIEFKADITGWTTKDVTITATSDDPDYEIELKSEDSDWSVRKDNKITVSKNQQINARLKKLVDKYSEDVATYNVTNIDKDAPDKTAPALKATTNSITVTFKQKDDGSGIAKREYSIDNGATWKAGDSVFTFSGLTQGKKYEIITRATDRVENQSISDVSYITTETIPAPVVGSNLTFTPSTSSWTNGNVSVNVATTITGYTLQTSTDGKTWGTTNPLTYSVNGTAYARLWDGNNASAVATTNITNIDKLAPTNTAPTVATTTNKITITNKQVDQNAGSGSGKSDLNASKTQYRLVTDTNGTTAVTGKDWQSSNVFSGLTQNTTYYVQTKVTDNAGNTTTSAVATAKTTSVPTPTAGSNLTFTPTPSAWTNGNVSVKVTTTVTGYTLQTSTDGKSWSTTNPLTYSANGTAYARLWDGNNASAVATTNITNIDKLAPTNTAPTVATTTNIITITNKQVDQNAANGSGKSDLNASKTQYRLVTDTNGTTAVTGKDWQSSNVFSGLTQNTTYYVQTKVTDNAGNTTTSAVATAKTGTIPTPTTGSNLTFTPSTSSWTNGNVSVNVATTITGYTLQTSTDGKAWGTTNPLTYSVNGTAYARLWDGNNASAVATTNITNIDKLAPTNTTPTVATTTNKITVTLKQVDQNAANGSGKSDLNASKTQYRLVTDTNGTTAVTGKDWQSSNVFSGLTQNTTYYVQTKVTDNAGNTTTSAVATAKTGTIPTPTTGSNLTFTPSTSSWTNGNVSVNVATTITGYTLQTSTDGKTWGTTNPLTYSANGTAYARLWDGNNASAVATTNITNIDKLAPTNTAPTVATTTNKITITNKQVDQNAGSGSGKSDLNASKTQYRLVTDTNGTTAVTGKDWQSSNVFSGLTQNTTYYVQTKVTDNAGNTTTSAVATAKTTSVPTPTAGANVIFTPSTSSWTNGNVSVNVATTITGYTLQTSTDGKTWSTTNPLIYSANGTAYARLWDGNNASAVATTNITNIDKLAPTNTAPTVATTTNKITVTLKQVDQNAGSGSGKSDLNASKTQYRLVTDTNGTTAVTGKDWQSSNVFSGLTQNTTYYVQTKVTDNAGNTTTSAVATAKTTSIPTPTAGSNLTFTPTPSGWTNGNVSVKVTTTVTGYTLQTSTDGKSWSTTNPLTYSANGTAYARLWDGNNASAVATTNITNIDKLAPTNTAPTVATTTNKITITNKQVDQNAANGSGKSDLNASKTQYRLVTDTNGTTAVTGKDWQSSNVFSGLTQNTTYYVQTKVTDNAGNTTTSAVATAKTTSVPTPTAGSNLTFTPTPSDWTNGNVSVKVSTTVTGYTLQTSIDGKTWGATNPLIYSANGTAYARLWDGNNASAVATTNITNIDKTAPSFNAAVSNVSSTGYDVIITGVSDTQSGVNRFQCPTWTESNGQDDIDGAWTTSTKSRATKQADGSYKFRVNITDHKNENGKYITHVYGYDNVGNNKAIALSATVPAVTITWNANGGTAVNATSGKAGNAIGTLPTTTRTGYTFAGWFTAASGGTQITTTSTYPTSGNVTYYAHWNVNQYAVTCEDWFVDSSNNRKVKLGSASKNANYGTTVNGSEWGTEASVSKYYSSYVYKSSTSATVGTSGATVYRYFYIWIDVNILNPSGVQDYKSAYFSLSNDGTNWDTNLVNESSKSNNLPYGTVLRIKDLRPYYEYYEYDSCSGCTYSNGQWTYTATAPNSMVIKMKDRTYSLQINPNGGTWNGTSAVSTLNKKYSEVTSISAPTRTGYTFTGFTELLNTQKFNDGRFDSGNNGVGVYNNIGNGQVTVTRQAKSSDNPIGGSYELKVTNAGQQATSPNLGGFVQNLMSEANKKYVHLFIAKLPTGYYFYNRNNPLGNGSSTFWLTSNKGTGNWQVYAYQVNTGSSGTFSTFGHVDASPSATSEWVDRTGAYTAYLAFSNIYDITTNNAGIGQIDGSAVLTANWQDKTAPTTTAPTATTTTNSITVTNKQTDSGSGIASIQYQIKKNSDSTWGSLQSGATFNGLTQNTKYDVRTHAVDKAGNASDSAVTTVTTGTIPGLTTGSNLTFTPTPSDWTNGNVSVKVSTTVTGYTLQTSTDGKTWGTTNPLIYSANGTAYARLWDGNNASAVATTNITNIDKLAPTNTAPTVATTTNKITATLKQVDQNAANGSGKSDLNASKTQYRLVTDTNGTTAVTGKDWQSSNVFSELSQNTTYYVQTKVTDNAGNTTTSAVATAKTDTIPTPTTGANVIFTPSTSSWTNGNVSVNVATTITGYTLQTSTDGKTWGTTNPLIYSANGTAYARLWDGNNASAVATTNITNIDKLAPTNTAPTVATTTNKITATLKQVDQNAANGSGKSDLNASKTQYRLVTDTNGTTAVTGKDWQSSNVFSGLTQNTTYYVQTKVTDNAGNTTTSAVATAKTTSIPTPTTGSNLTFTPSTSSWTNGNVNVTVSTTITGFTLQTSTDGKTWGTANPLTYSANGTAYARLWDGNNASAVATTNITNIDKLAPTNTAPTVATTTNKITATLKQVDQNAGSGSGKSDLNASKTQYRLVTDTNGTTAVTGKDWQSSNVFSGLTQNTTYYVQTKVTDNAGNTTTSAVATAKTTIVPSGTTSGVITLTPDHNTWTNTDVKVTATTNQTGYTIQMSTDGKTFTDGTSKTLTSNGTVYARLRDPSNNYGASASISISIIDKVAPKVDLVEEPTNYINSQAKIKVTTDVENKYTKGYYAPWSNNGGAVEDVSSTESGPITSSKTWKLIKTGTGNQWNGWQGTYDNIFSANVGDKIMISGYYKTSASAGFKNLSAGNVYKSDWSIKYNTTTEDSKLDIVEDGKWNYFYTIFKANETFSNATIDAGPSWWYSTKAGTLYINGLNWRIIPSSNTTAKDIHFMKYATGSQNSSYFESGNGTYLDGNEFTITNNGTYTVWAKDIAGNTTIKTINITNFDKEPPTTTAPTVTNTTNRITVTNKQTDALSGIASIQYQIKKNSDSAWGTLQSGATFNGLTQNTKYDVRTHAVDKAGNASDSAVTTVTTGTIPGLTTGSNLTFTPSTSSWTNGNVNVTVSTTITGYTLQTSTDGKSWGTTNPLTYTANGTAYARLWDGNNASAVATTNITNIDKLAPTNTAPTVATTTNKITITNKQVDQNAGSGSGKSDLNASKTQYRLVTDTNGTTAVTGKDWQSSNVFSGLTQNTTYYVQTKVTDNAGNTTTSAVATTKTTSIPTPTTGSNLTFTPSTSSWTNGNVNVTVSTTITGYTLQTSTDGKSWSTTNPLTYSANGTAYARLWDGNNASAVATTNITNIDKLAPTNTAPTVATTTNKITITNKQVDQNAGSGSGKSDLNASKTQYRLVTDTNGTTAVTGKDWQSSNVFSGLTQNTTYYVQTKVTDNAGNTTTSAVATAKTTSVPTPTAGSNLTFTPSTSSWTNGNVSVAVSTTVKGYTLQTSTDGKTWSTTNPLIYSANGTAYARLWDGNNASAVATTNITNIDKLAPTNTAPTVATTTNKITVTLKQVDQNAANGSGKSDLNASKTQYRLVTDTNGTTAVTGKDWQLSNVFSGLTQNTTYYVQTKVTDNAGNTTASAVATAKTGTIPKLVPETPVGTKIGTTANIDGQTLDWYLFDVDETEGKAYLVSTPTYWVPDTTKEVSGAYPPKLVSSANENTGAIRQAIQKKASGTAWSSYTYEKATYTPSDTTLNYFKSVNPLWRIQRGSKEFASLNENEKEACYLADADIFAGIKDQVNKADGNLKGKIQTLVGGASAEQWCKAYNKQSAASTSKITCAYQETHTPGYIYLVNGTAQNSGWYTNNKTIVGNDIYGAAYTYNRSNNSTYPFSSCWWWLASPSAFSSSSVCSVSGTSSSLLSYNSNLYGDRFSLFASVALDSISIDKKNLTFTATPSGWTNGNVSVKVTTTVTGYTLQTSTDGKSWGTTNPLTYSANGTAYARLWDGNNASAVATTSITNIDKLAPTNTAPTVATTTNKITVTLKQVDQNAANGSGKSDLNASKTQYRLVTNTSGTTAVTGKDWQSSNVFSGLTQNTTYYVQTKVTDNAGNTTTSAVATAKTGTIPTPVRGSNITFTATPTTKTSGNVTVKVSTTVTGYTLQTSTNGSTWGTTNPLTFTANGTAYARLWDGNNASAVATFNITNIDKTNYSISYNLNGGSASGNPTSYKVDSSTITINAPTRVAYKFLGWTGSNDLSSGLGNYTSSSPYVAASRDHILGNEFNVTAGEKYRVFVRGTRTKGNLNLQGGIWYTAQTSGKGYDGYGGSFTEIETGLFYKEITIPTGKTKGKFYIQLDQDTSGGSTSWKLYDMHVIKVENPTIPKGSQGNKSFTANWKLSIDANTPVGTKIGTTANIDGQTLNWYLFDVSDDGKTAYLVSTPTHWVPDTTKPAVRGAWVPKLVSRPNSNTGAMKQAIQKKASGTSYSSYTYSQSSVTYTPSANTLSYYKNVNSQWSAQRGSVDFKSLNENEQEACYLADADIFAGIKDQVNNADGNLKVKIQTLVGGASIEQWCKAYNKQSAASSSKITCEYRDSKKYGEAPGYICKVNGTAQNAGFSTNIKTIVGNDIYGAASTNNHSDNSTYPFSKCYWWLASPSAYDSDNLCGVTGKYSCLSTTSSNSFDYRFSLFASVAL